MSVYILSRLSIFDRAEYEKYENQFEEVFANFNGKLLSVDEEPLVLAGEWEATRSVLMEFPSKEDAFTWMQSDAYQRISKHRNAGSTLSSILVKSSETDQV
ncbi:MAG: hypothetical protein ACI9LX_000803 [Paraglaciecola sp.]|jgi:uncharacterized protein (DUF1330 family)